MVFWCLRFPPKIERKQVDLRNHSSKVEFFRSFSGGTRRHKKAFRNYLTFSRNHPKYFYQCSTPRARSARNQILCTDEELCYRSKSGTQALTQLVQIIFEGVFFYFPLTWGFTKYFFCLDHWAFSRVWHMIVCWNFQTFC